MKMKEFGPPGGGARPWRPLGSANGSSEYVDLGSGGSSAPLQYSSFGN